MRKGDKATPSAYDETDGALLASTRTLFEEIATDSTAEEDVCEVARHAASVLDTLSRPMTDESRQESLTAMLRQLAKNGANLTSDSASEWRMTLETLDPSLEQPSDRAVGDHLGSNPTGDVLRSHGLFSETSAIGHSFDIPADWSLFDSWPFWDVTEGVEAA
jgi:hypothetical protein